MTYQTLTLHIDQHVATVTLNRPQARNAFNEEAIAELAEVFLVLGRDVNVRAIVLAANGIMFCAGADRDWMKRMAGYSHEQNVADAMQLAEMLNVIYRCPKPTIAKIQGDCYAGGMGLAAACDVIVSSDAAFFCLSEVRIGLIPGTIAPYVIKAMGEQACRRFFLTAERFTAQEAHQNGFVQVIAPLAELDGVVARMTGALVNNSSQAMADAKSLIQEMAGRDIDEALIAASAKKWLIVGARTTEKKVLQHSWKSESHPG